jgi:cobyrinic acid a,c-diamide synthase
LNLDSWAMQPAQIRGLMRAADGADLVLAEGSMGLFDGVAKSGETGIGASADIAALAGWPVVLALDISGQAQSAAAVAHGFATLRKDVALAGVVLNRVASSRHEALARAGMEAAGIRVLGALPRRPSVAIPERHLGLVQAEEQPRLAEILGEMADFIAGHLDLLALRAIAARAQTGDAAEFRKIPPPGNRVALARDAAFSFIYPHLLAGWRAAGAEILPFSPLADEAPDASADACWLPGGYPELHAGRLTAAARFRSGLRSFAAARPVHGECGGYMAMGEALVDASGARHEMAGLFKLVTSFEKRRMHLGYRLARLESPIPGHGAGARLRGHEFHYASILEHSDAPLAHVVDATGAVMPETGSCRTFESGGRATGSFFHLIAEAT